MLRQHVNGYDMGYIDLGDGPPLVCIHGSLGDFRVWSAVLGPLSRQHRVIAPSLRHFFPGRWDGSGIYTIAQHIADTIGFIEALGLGPVHLMGHSRGGHIAFRVAQQRPDLVQRLVLAEPGGELDTSLAPPFPTPPPMRNAAAEMAEKVAAGAVDDALEQFIERVEGIGVWSIMPEPERQALRENAATLVAQVDEQRQPYSLRDAKAIRVPTLLVGGENTPGHLPVVLHALAAHVPGAQVVIIPNTRHFMLTQDPAAYCAAVLPFLAG